MIDNGEHFFKDPYDTVGEFEYCSIDYKVDKDTNNFPKEFFAIIDACLCEGKLDNCFIGFMGNRLEIRGSRGGKSCSFLIKLRNYDLRIKKVQFIQQRKNHMTDLQDVLQQIEAKYNLKKIEIEAVQTVAMENWCKKNHYKCIPGTEDYIEP